jgi:hypothetical protein
VAEVSWPFSTADVDDDQWAAMAPLWSQDGIDPASPAVSLGSGLTFNVPAAFGGWVHGFYYSNTSTLAKTAANNVNSNPRLDQLVLRLNRSTFAVTAQIKTGTPASSPVLPALTQDNTTWEIPVAYATCPGSASAQNYSGLTLNYRVAGTPDPVREYAEFSSTGSSWPNAQYNEVPYQTTVQSNRWVQKDGNAFYLRKPGLWTVTATATTSGTATRDGKYLAAFFGNNCPAHQDSKFYSPQNSGSFAAFLCGDVVATDSNPGHVGFRVRNYTDGTTTQVGGNIQFKHLG